MDSQTPRSLSHSSHNSASETDDPSKQSHSESNNQKDTVHSRSQLEDSKTDIRSDGTTQPISKLETQRSDLYKACKNNKINRVRKILQTASISTINRIEENGATALHVATYHGHNEIVKLLLDSGASTSIRHKIRKLTAYEEAKTQETQDLFKRRNDRSRFIGNLTSDVIEWTLIFREPGKRRARFFQQLIKLLLDKSINRGHQTSLKIDQILLKLENNYLDALLIPDQLPITHQKMIKWFFSSAVSEKDPTYILRAYTSATNFYKTLNKQLAINALDYFEPTVNYATDYKLVRALIDIVAIVTHCKQFEKYRFKGETYRGMLLTEQNLLEYTVGSEIMNKSFLSTSKTKVVAEIYSGEGQQTDSHVSTICTYVIKNDQTALDIEDISEVPDEQEVLIVPFSVFKIINVERCNIIGAKNNGALIAMKLEECNAHVAYELSNFENDDDYATQL
ncbi:unnamed protein product [Didymodactylos carnosus]|uniref:NAD(P)(+)--arginine ADP-ribosyltransferase n=2 Tax=Didymodactylos carnosus TaxID=1234261 RepID=A0A814XJY4_9BILA|nr:unnamed protein product [Didymodactylos carnosus]CAF3976217.1 unnamed protein product [Didymodactylos carnosus]